MWLLNFVNVVWNVITWRAVVMYIIIVLKRKYLPEENASRPMYSDGKVNQMKVWSLFTLGKLWNKAQSFVFICKEPLSDGHPVNTAKFLWSIDALEASFSRKHLF